MHSGIEENGMNKIKYITFYLLLVSVLILQAEHLAAQPKVRLIRTNKAGNPLKFQLYGGYNGMSTPDDKLQDMFENTNMTNWGGLISGLKVLMVLDTIGLPVWLGVHGYFQRTMKRSLYDAPGVHYPDSPNRVEAIEQVSAYGVEGLLAIGPFYRMTWEIGGGAQHLYSVVDHQTVILGVFQPVWLPTAMTAINFELLKYEHGSIDANFRFLKTFGEYKNFQFQSLFCITFNL
jgi:hypothetical protein